MPGFGSLAPEDSLVPPPANPARPPQAILDLLHGMFVQPVQDAGRALQGRMTPDEAQNFAAEAAMGLIPISRAVKPLAGAAKGIRGYHGSPHDFDKFDISKIGTGEGAQAYGHGLYIAEKEATAKTYRDALSNKLATPSPDYDALWTKLGGHLRERGHSEARIRSALADLRGEHQAGGQLRDVRAEMFPAEYQPVVKDALDLGGKTLDAARGVSSGRMYEVNINARPEQFLDWNKPLGTVPPELRSALDRSIREEFTTLKDPAAATGEDLYSALRDRSVGWKPGAGVPLNKEMSGASSSLRDAGIPGIKYLDQGSRGGGQGSSNYVVFDDKLIDILRKYGLAGGMAAPAFGSLAPQSPAEQ